MIRLGRGQIIFILFVALIGPLYALPNILSESQRTWLATNMPAIVPHKAMGLGLDLQGGSHLQLQVAVADVVTDKLDSLATDLRTRLREAKITPDRVVATPKNVTVSIKDDAARDAAEKLFTQAFGVDLSVQNNSTAQNIVLAYSDVALTRMRQQAVAQSIEIIRRRVDETGTKEPMIQAQGNDRIIVQLPGVRDPEHMKALLGKTARLTFHMVDMDVTAQQCLKGQAPLSVRCLPMADNPISLLPVQRRALLTGDMLTDAQPGFGQNGEAIVNFKFDSLGARRFADATRDNVGKPFAVVLDGEVITAPRINEPILGGSGQISGNFNTQSANDLAILLRAGALPAPMKVIEERSVGPSLGADSIASGKLACGVAVLLVIGFMFLIYGFTFGMFANIALVINVAWMIGFLSLIGSTLTLPGIVGIVLSIGMAVDANVLIFERMKEERRAGRPVVSAVDAGFQGAMSSILDANITSLIAALVLFAVGTGPVRGFAVTLGVGIVTSLFAAIYFTRVLVVAWLKLRNPKELPIQ